MSEDSTDEIISVRLPRGTANKIRAASGQPLSRFVRWMLTSYLELQNSKSTSLADQFGQAAVDTNAITRGAQHDDTETEKAKAN